MNGRPITPEVQAEIIHCYTQLGWSLDRIGAYLDRSRSTIHGVLRRTGTPLRPTGRPCTVNRTLVAELFPRLPSMKTVARIAGCHRTSLYYTPKP
jgi:hypothetical protein